LSSSLQRLALTEDTADASLRQSHCAADLIDTGPLTSFALQRTAGQWGGERGSEVSPRSFRPDELTLRQPRNSSAQPVILLLKTFEFLQLFGSHPAILLKPAIERLSGYLHLPYWINARNSSTAKYRNMP